jgi:hypothetical protein
VAKATNCRYPRVVMPILKNGRVAVIERAKFTSYALDPTHEDGRHKARVFKAALGFDATNAADFDRRHPIRYHDQ